jgi:hypothetical protein
MRTSPPEISSTRWAKYSMAGWRPSSPDVLAIRRTTGSPEPPALSTFAPSFEHALATIAAVTTAIVSLVRACIRCIVPPSLVDGRWGR